MLLCAHEDFNLATGFYVPSGAEPVGVQMFVVTYNDVVPTGYVNADQPEHWARYRYWVEGTVAAPHILDYISIRTKIIALVEAITGTNYSAWGSLSVVQKNVATKWCNIRIANEVGISQYYAYCGGQMTGLEYITQQLQESFKARSVRYTLFQVQLYAGLGKVQGMKEEKTLNQEALKQLYLGNGVAEVSVDGSDGVVDFLKSTGSFATTGLKARIDSTAVTFGGNSQTFVDGMANILTKVD